MRLSGFRIELLTISVLQMFDRVLTRLCNWVYAPPQTADELFMFDDFVGLSFNGLKF